MVIFDRTHRLADDLSWAPSRLRKLWADHYPNPVDYQNDDDSLDFLAGVPYLEIVGIPILVLRKLAWWIGKDRSATYDDQLHLGRAGENAKLVAVAELAAVPADELVGVRGRVVADGTIPGVVSKNRGVVRKLAFRAAGTWWIHEAAIEFSLEDEKHDVVGVQVSNARLLAPLGRPEDQTIGTYASEHTPDAIKSRLSDYSDERSVVPSAERVVRDGEDVIVFGYPTSTAEPSYRDAPRQISLSSGAQPLLILPRW